ncbi:bacteriorhodopsin [Qipengyuania spongiae]|uniref:Bacteriorhodopsin n=1 Tax=Qipengyuania spongiae TaxID=2909673 RepID=A0ABY5SZY8_9SPHN|nr:bacteriorhodopsin [Qipengyuania spongiae]UVI40107.1 bacteriorhodopsin [Qipengyuania spongiae]
MSAQQLPLLIGFIVMALGSLAIFAHGDKRREFRHHTQFHSVVPFIAGTAYLAMLMGTGVFVVNDVTIYLPRYLDWSVTTPILLTGLILTGLHEHPRHSTYVLPAIVLDVIMIATGLLAALAEDPGQKLVWFAWSCAAFLGVLYILWRPVLAIGDRLGGAIETVYRKNLVFLTAVWLIYPVAFAIGPEGLRIIGDTGSLWLILILDVTAKVVYSFLATSRFRSLPVGDASGAIRA